MIRSMCLLILLISCFATVRIGGAAEKLIADYGGHAGFQRMWSSSTSCIRSAPPRAPRTP